MKVLKYTLINTEPLSITDLYNSKSDEAEVLPYVNASTLRGAVMNRIAEKGRLEGNLKRAFFDGRILFGNGYPVILGNDGNEHESIPSPKGFMERKDQSGEISHIFTNEIDANKKRAQLGKFSYLDYAAGKIEFASPLEGENFKTRLARNYMAAEEDNSSASRNAYIKQDNTAKQALFRGSFLEKGQKFTGTVKFSDKCEDEIIEIVEDTLKIPGYSLGGMRNSGCGSVDIMVAAAEPVSEKHLDQVLESVKKSKQGDYYYLDMLCVSGLCMVNEFGEPCGLNEKELAEYFGADFKIENSSTSVTHYCSFNRTTGGRSPEVPVFEGGSIFRLAMKKIPEKSVLGTLEESGLGTLKGEGFGAIMFLADITSFTRKESLDAFVTGEQTDPALLKTETYRQDVDNMKLMCAKAMLKAYIEKRITEYVNLRPLKETEETKSQRGMFVMLCKSLKYEPEKAKEQFEEYIRHSDDKDARIKHYIANYRSRSALLNTVKAILETPLFDLLSTGSRKSQDKDQNENQKLEDRKFCGIPVCNLINPKTEMSYKLDLIEALMII